MPAGLEQLLTAFAQLNARDRARVVSYAVDLAAVSAREALRG